MNAYTDVDVQVYA